MIYLILIFAFVLRFINLNQSLWLDEAINIVYAGKLSIMPYLFEYLMGDFHPPLHFAILWVWTHIFGFSEIASRFPSLIFGIGTIFITFLIGRKYSKNVGLMAALLLSLAPLHIYYSQEARPYSLAAFAATLCSYYFLKFLENSSKTSIGFLLASAMVFYSDYVAYFLFPAQALYIFINYRKKIINYFKFVLLSLVIFSPWLLIFPRQVSIGIETSKQVQGWKDVVGGTSFKEIALFWVKTIIGRITFENKLVYAFAAAIPTGLNLLILFKLKKEIKSVGYLIFWFILPPIFAFVFSFFVPVFSYFRFIFVLPAFYILLAVGIEKFERKFRVILLTAVLLFQGTFSFIYLFNSNYHREDWQGAVKFIDQVVSPKSIVLFKNNEIVAPYSYYSHGGNKALPSQKKISVKNSLDLIDLKSALKNIDKVYLFDYLEEVTDPQGLVKYSLIENKFAETKIFNFRGVGFIHLYEKNN